MEVTEEVKPELETPIAKADLPEEEEVTPDKNGEDELDSTTETLHLQISTEEIDKLNETDVAEKPNDQAKVAVVEETIVENIEVHEEKTSPEKVEIEVVEVVSVEVVVEQPAETSESEIPEVEQPAKTSESEIPETTQESEESITEQVEVANISSNSSAPPKKDASLLESIASDWCFSDGEQEETEEKTEPETVEVRAISPKPPVSPEANRSSAEIIAMDWEEETPASNNESNENLICEESGKEGQPVEESVLILHDLNLSELNIPPNERNTNNITIISVDDNTEPVNQEESVVIHEIEVIKPRERLDKKISSKTKANYYYNICSKKEIDEEIISKTEAMNQAKLDKPNRSDILLKSKILKRLASKISLENEIEPEETSQTKRVPDKELLDILEGDDADLDVYNLEPTKHEDQSESLITLNSTGKNRRRPPKPIIDPITEREIALRQLSEIPEKSETILRKPKKAKSSLVVNVPSTIIIEKAEKSAEGVDPFKFVENIKTEGTPSKYGPGLSSIKTYNRKSVDKAEPGIKEIMQNIPKEILDLEKEHNARKQNKKSPVKIKTEPPSPTKNVKKKNSEPVKEKIDKDSSKNKVSEPVKNKIAEKKSTTAEKKSTTAEKPVENNVIISKSSRIIKKKIIWDPSLEFVSPLPKTSNKVQKSKDKTPISKKPVKAGNEIKKEGSDYQDDDDDEYESLEDEESNDSGSDYEPTGKAKSKTKTPPKKNPKVEEIDNTSEKSVSSKKSEKVTKKKPIDVTSVEDEEEESDDDVSEKSSGKRKSDSHTPKRKKKIKLSEVDKLLMDEGAVNMLYSVESDEKVPLIKQKQKVISMDKFDKEMVKKKRMIMSALTTTPEVAPKALRKKESPSATQQRKKSREFSQDPLQSPPPSPSTMFPPRAEASRIIRRHSSSSSFSSECMSPRRLSVVDHPGESTKRKAQKSNGNANEFWDDVSKVSEDKSATEEKEERLHAKKMRGSDQTESRSLRKRPDVPLPTPKKTKTPSGVSNSKEDSHEKPTDKIGSKESGVSSNETTKLNAHQEPFPVEITILEKYDSNDNYKEITLRKTESLVHLTLTPQSSKIKNTLNIQTMKEICDALTTLRKDSTCKVVVLTSIGNVFCRGLDYAPLIQTNAEKRKTIAVETSNAVSELIRAFINFPKPLIAGVQGAASGLGVSILPLCDLVFVSDNSTFTMNHCKLGCLPEGAACVTLPHATNQKLPLQLLYLGVTIKDGHEAQRHNLANVVIKHKWFFEELISTCKDIASKSSQSMESIKAIHLEPLRSKVEAALQSESHLLVQHWTSAECQQLFKTALEQNSW